MIQVFLATREFLRGEEGVTAIEYGLIAGLIAVAVIATVYAIGQQLDSFFLRLQNCLANSANC